MANIVKNIGWSSLDGICTQVIYLATLGVLMKLLPPRLFGIMAMLNIFINVSHILVNSGFSQALIQRKDLKAGHYSTVFWLNLLTGILLYFLLYACTPLVSLFFDEPSLNLYFPVALLPLVVTATYLVHQTILEKAINFKKKALINISAAIAGSGLSMYLGFAGYGIWALLWPPVLIAVTTSILYWLFVTWRPQWHFSIQEAKTLFSYGVFLTGSQLFGTLTRKVDDLLIGKFLSATDLGIYHIAYKILMFPLNTIKSKISNVLFPAFSLHSQLDRLQSAHLRATRLTLIIITPFLVLLFILNEDLIKILLAPEWQALSSITSVFAITSIFISIGYPIQILYALGQSKRAFYITLTTRCIFFALLLFAVLNYDDLGVIVLFISVGLVQINLISNYFAIKAINGNLVNYFNRTVVNIILPYLIPGVLIFWASRFLESQLIEINLLFVILTKCVIFSIFTTINPLVRNHIKQLFLIARQYVPK